MNTLKPNSLRPLILSLALATLILLSAAPAFAGEVSTFTVYNCSNSDDGVDVFSYNADDTDLAFSYDSNSVSKGGSHTFSCEGEGCQVQYASLFGDDV